MISKRASQISPSPTLAITAKANQMKAQGIKVVGFGAGEPDFDTPTHIKNAAKEALDRGFTKYTPTSGIPDLKNAICKKLKRDNGLDYASGEVLVSCGAKHSLFNAVLALCDEEDEILLPAPYWVSYEEMIKVAGGKSVILRTTDKNNFKITAKQLDGVITSKTKLLILCSPSNPTGMLYEKSELEEIARVVEKAGITVLSDEIYEKLVYDGTQHVSIASLSDKMRKQTIVINGVSKAYAMTGWRIGYAAGPKEIIQAMSNLQDHSTSNPTSIAQVGAVKAIEGDQADLEKMVVEFRKRRNFMVEKVNAIPGLRVVKPQGAFYCFVNVSSLYGKSIDGKKVTGSLALTDLLLERAQVAVVPGCVFGDDDYIRLSYATSMKNIEEGLSRISNFIKELELIA